MGAEIHVLQQLPELTPVRRRECSQNHVSPSAAGQAPWTTSRCNRLLRPISSRIAALRKEKEGKLDEVRHASLADGKHYEQAQHTCVRTHAGKPPKDDDDPDWAPDYGARKRLKRTYSSRGSNKGENRIRGGRISSKGRELPERTTFQLPFNVATCSVDGGELVRGISSQDVHIPNCAQALSESTDPDSFPATNQSRYFSGPQGAGPFRRLAQKSSPENWIPINGLYNGLDALLRATSSAKSKKSFGTRSLFATCIRKTPQYISQEQRDISKREDPEDVEDVSLSVYTELESLSQSESGGWKPLRELVRSHGIALLREAILDYSIPMTVARGLVILCQHADAIDEAEELVTGMLLRSGRLPKPRNTSDLLFERYFSLATFTLKEFAIQNLRYNFLYHQLADLLNREDIPIQWVSSPDMASIWNMIVMHIAEEGPYAHEAAKLLSITVSKSFSYDQERLDQALAKKRKRRVERPRKRKRVPFSNPERSVPLRSVIGIRTGSDDGATLLDNKKETDVTNSVTNVLTVLLTVDRVRHYSEGPETLRKPSIRLLFQEMEIAILTMHELSFLSITNDKSTTPLLRMALTLFVKTIFLPMYQQGRSSIPETRTWNLLGTLMKNRKIRESMASALCGIVLCHAKAGLETSLAYFQDIQQSLLLQSAHIFDDANSRYLLRKILVDAAFEFADESKNQHHLDWALELEETVHDDDEKSIRQAEGRTPLRPSTRNATGYRWEEGISEWIARTPAAKFSHVQITRAFKPLPDVAEPIATITPTETEETESPVVDDALVSSPLRTSSTCYVRIEIDRRNSAPSHQCISSRMRRGSIKSTDVPPRLLIESRPRSQRRRTVSMSEKLVQTTCAPDDQADELSTADSSQETALAYQEAAVKSRPILREISNLTRSCHARHGDGKGVMPEGTAGRRTRVPGPVGAGARRPRLTTRSSWSGVGEGSDDELGF